MDGAHQNSRDRRQDTITPNMATAMMAAMMPNWVISDFFSGTARDATLKRPFASISTFLSYYINWLAGNVAPGELPATLC